MIRCPECKRVGKQHGGTFIEMLLTLCEVCNVKICAACWEKHYLRHTGKHPAKEYEKNVLLLEDQ